MSVAVLSCTTAAPDIATMFCFSLLGIWSRGVLPTSRSRRRSGQSRPGHQDWYSQIYHQSAGPHPGSFGRYLSDSILKTRNTTVFFSFPILQLIWVSVYTDINPILAVLLQHLASATTAWRNSVLVYNVSCLGIWYQIRPTLGVWYSILKCWPILNQSWSRYP